MASYVQLLGTVADKDGGNSTTLSFTGVSITIGQSVFVGVGENNPDGDGMAVTDNLGNVYTLETICAPGPGTFAVAALFLSRVTVVGTITTITVTQTNTSFATGVVAGLFANIPAAYTSTQETLFGPSYGSPTLPIVLLQTGPPQGIGVAIYAVRTNGFIGYDPGTLVGTASTSGGADSSNVAMGLGYINPVPGTGITGTLVGDGSRSWTMAGKAYGIPTGVILPMGMLGTSRV